VTDPHFAETPGPPSDGAQIWRVDLHTAAGRGVGQVLSPDELGRASRFVFERERRRFIVGRVALRSILACHLDCTPAAVELQATNHGRPTCAALGGQLDFNLSNSEDIAVIALTREAPVGIDVECVRHVPDAIELSKRYYSAEEAESIKCLSGQERDRAFLTCWTRKEAVLKAIGLGLYLDPAQVRTGITAHPMTVPTPHGTFEIKTFSIGDNAVATLATPRVVRYLHLQAFHPDFESSDSP
jgi:4'-phosphopantetheinyl transferase